MDFTTKLEKRDIDINGLHLFLELEKDIDIDIESATATIYWSLEIDAREYGIKDISAIIRKVDIGVEVEYYEYDDSGEESDKIYKDFELSISESKFIKNEIKVTDSSLYPNELILHLGSKEHHVEIS
jgi:hypothetical protein